MPVPEGYPFTVVLHCDVCNASWEWQCDSPSSLRSRYCKNHRSPASRERAKHNCPTPDKIRFVDRVEAVAVAFKSVKRRGRSIRIYPCSCGGFHLTSKVNNKKDANVE